MQMSRFTSTVKVKQRGISSLDSLSLPILPAAAEIKTADRNDNFTLNDPFVMEISVPLNALARSTKAHQQRSMNYESSELSVMK